MARREKRFLISSYRDVKRVALDENVCLCDPVFDLKQVQTDDRGFERVEL